MHDTIRDFRKKENRAVDALGRVLRKDGQLWQSFVIAPAYGHERQCKAQTFNSLVPKRCGNFACRGREFCHFHGGRVPTGKRIKWKNGRVSIYYSKFLGEPLAALADKFASQTPLEAIQIHEEVAVIRAAATKALQFAAAAFQSEKSTDATKLVATQLIISTMTQVSQVVERAAKIEAMADDKISVKSAVKLIDQIIRVMHDVLGDENNDVIKLIADRITAEVRMPLESVRGHRDEDTTVGAMPIAIGVVNMQVNEHNYSQTPNGVLPDENELENHQPLIS